MLIANTYFVDKDVYVRSKSGEIDFVSVKLEKVTWRKMSKLFFQSLQAFPMKSPESFQTMFFCLGDKRNMKGIPYGLHVLVCIKSSLSASFSCLYSYLYVCPSIHSSIRLFILTSVCVNVNYRLHLSDHFVMF